MTTLWGRASELEILTTLIPGSVSSGTLALRRPEKQMNFALAGPAPRLICSEKVVQRFPISCSQLEASRYFQLLCQLAIKIPLDCAFVVAAL